MSGVPEIPKACEICLQVFTVKPWRKNKARFCSKACQRLSAFNTPQRFWNRYYETENGCWLRKKRPEKHRYGFVTFNGLRDSAHRMSYRLAYGDIPDGMHVCHKCDTPECVNPDHLFLGTNYDNMRDMVAKGRQGQREYPKGEDNPCSIFTEDQVRQIKSLLQTTSLSERKIAAQFNVSRGAIRSIKIGKSWKHITI